MTDEERVIATGIDEQAAIIVGLKAELAEARRTVTDATEALSTIGYNRCSPDDRCSIAQDAVDRIKAAGDMRAPTYSIQCEHGTPTGQMCAECIGAVRGGTLHEPTEGSANPDD